jgi:hypothetical protein
MFSFFSKKIFDFLQLKWMYVRWIGNSDAAAYDNLQAIAFSAFC